MTRPGKLPVEPLSEKRWDAIERGVLDRLDTPHDAAAPDERHPTRPWIAIGSGLVLAAALAALAFVARERPPDPQPLATTRVATEAAPVATSFGEVSVEVDPRSELTAVGGDAEGWLIVLERGRATFEVPPRRDRPALVVQAGGTRVEVVGTRFTVERADVVTVTVDHGRVRVLDAARAWELGPGERWPARGSAAEAVVPSIATTDVTEPAADEAPARSIEEPSPLDARDRFERASALEARDPERALARYAELERGGDAWAANALFARGRLALELGRRDEGSAALRRYLDRFPRGANAEDARALLADPR